MTDLSLIFYPEAQFCFWFQFIMMLSFYFILFYFDAGDQTVNQQDYTLKTCNVAMVPEIFFHSGYGKKIIL